MRSRISAGLLLYRFKENELQFFIVHPGGPLFKKKDEGYWSIPKGEVDNGEDLLTTAIRETEEETGIRAEGEFLPLGSITQKGGKVVHAWALEYKHMDDPEIVSNTFQMEFPPNSGIIRSFPEIDRGKFCNLAETKLKLKAAQTELVDRLIDFINSKKVQ
ncbi:MAG TPA: NUDIX domain-containing protein [Ignavibacteriaceae bacterium]|nr:NUDIX domain-containing protein [Ignavibacteriaceae bacterium]